MKIELEAETVIAGHGFVAHAGDTLIVFNGICLGVKGDVRNPPSQPKLTKATDPSQEEILAVVYNQQPVNSRGLSDALRIPRDEVAARARLQTAVRRMVIRGILAVHPDDAATKARYPRFIVRAPQQPSA